MNISTFSNYDKLSLTFVQHPQKHSGSTRGRNVLSDKGFCRVEKSYTLVLHCMLKNLIYVYHMETILQYRQ